MGPHAGQNLVRRLLPVAASASERIPSGANRERVLRACPRTQTPYGHRTHRHFVETKCFDDPLLIQIHDARRVLGGRKISEEAWRAIEATQIQTGGGANQLAPQVDPRLLEARG